MFTLPELLHDAALENTVSFFENRNHSYCFCSHVADNSASDKAVVWVTDHISKTRPPTEGMGMLVVLPKSTHINPPQLPGPGYRVQPSSVVRSRNIPVL